MADARAARRILYVNNTAAYTARSRAYYAEHKDYWKRYREAHRVTISTRNKARTDCPCGGKYTHINKAGHMRTKKHLRYVAAQELSNSDV